MYQMSQAENNDKTAQVTEREETFREKYDRLKDGQKRRIMQSFKDSFEMSRATFFLKLNGKTVLRKPEKMFFINNL